MTKNEFMEFMKENFELNPIHRNLLLAITTLCGNN